LLIATDSAGMNRSTSSPLQRRSPNAAIAVTELAHDTSSSPRFTGCQPEEIERRATSIGANLLTLEAARSSSAQSLRSARQ
jgi:hypothetical protein